MSMGGGAAMRAAGKVAGLGVFNGGLRGATAAAPPASQSLRNVSRPVGGIMSNGKVAGGEVAEAQKGAWEIDDWEFAGGEEDLLVAESYEPMARVVFGGAPSIEEAKEATCDLKEALDKIYLSPAISSGYENGEVDAALVGRVPGLPLLPSSEFVETKSCLTCDQNSPSVPKNAVKAFRMLSESPAVQSVVASIACDPNVWNAVMHNEALIGFIQSHRTNDLLQDQVSCRKFDDLSNKSQEEETESHCGDTKSQHGVAGSEVGETGSQFDAMVFLEQFKQRVSEMVSNVGDFLKNIFGMSTDEKTTADANFKLGMSTDEKTTADANFKLGMFEKTLGASFVGLATMVIMVVLLKRI